MSQNVPLPQNTRLRLPIIKQGLKENLTHEQIGERCKVTEKTIDRDMKLWVQSGEFEIWLKTEWAELHNYCRQANPLVTYKILSGIVARMVTQKREIKQEITEDIHEQIDVSVYDDSDKSILDKAARLLERKGARESSGLH